MSQISAAGLTEDSLREYLPKLLEVAKKRWLKTYEIIQILQHFPLCPSAFPVIPDVIKKPSSGRLILYDKLKSRFRYDGINWKQRKGRKVPAENHAKLRLGGVEVINTFYTRSADDNGFQRRCYSLLESNESKSETEDIKTNECGTPIILVHYLRKEKSKTSTKKKENEESIVEEQPPIQQESNNEAETKNKNSIDDTPQIATEKPVVYEIPSPPPIEQFLASLGESNWGGGSHMEVDINQINQLHSSMYRPVGVNQHFYGPTAVPGAPMFDYLGTPSLPGLGVNENMGCYEKQSEMLFPVNQLIQLVEISPNWDWEDGGATVLLIFPQPLSTNTLFSVHFGKDQVTGEFITPTVLRCKAPAQENGVYTLIVYWNHHHQVTEGVNFEYKRNSQIARTSEVMETPEITFRCKILERIESIDQQIKDSKGKVNSEFFNIPDSEQLTLMHCACAAGYDRVVESLLHKGVCMEGCDILGHTPLHLAVIYKREHVIHSVAKTLGLEEFSKLICLRPSNGQTVIELAAASMQQDILKVLLHYSNMANSYVQSHFSSNEHLEKQIHHMVDDMQPPIHSDEEEESNEERELLEHVPLDLMDIDPNTDPVALAARVIQTVYRYAKDRRQYRVVKGAALIIQKSFRRFNAQKNQEKRKAAKTIANAWRNYSVQKNSTRCFNK